MIRNIVERIVGNKRYIVSAGLSTDAKPTDDIITGSRFLEVNTGVVCSFDEESQSWYALGKANYIFENWTTDTGGNVTDSENQNIDFRVGN